ncbi:hypothetical protein [Paraburkholderia sp. MM5384-R2]|uniref:hypothetical protein n=1 Tax=Paraburkholderia sp. MM5384-R2 TaxID=2723097 RepID=UPI00160C49AC|nr:hypothetical protein [Paraburkholderia sp. MM5384-R2]MBB5502633.1 hypothetical protein [Paraburkholderia sp. MM5384-R2]
MLMPGASLQPLRVTCNPLTEWRVTLITLPILPLVHFLGAYLPELRGRPLAIVYAFWEPFVAWGTILFLASNFQRRFDRLVGAWQPLPRRACTIYVIPPPVLVAVGLAWRNVPAAPLLKFAVTGSVGCALCYLLAGLLLRLPKLASIVKNGFACDGHTLLHGIE